MSKGTFEYKLDAIAPDGTAIPLAFGVTTDTVVDGRNQVIFDAMPREVSAGSRLRLRLYNLAATLSAARMQFGGEKYGDAGITLTYGHFEPQKSGASGKTDAAVAGRGLLLGGGLGCGLLSVLAGLAGLRHRGLLRVRHHSRKGFSTRTPA